MAIRARPARLELFKFTLYVFFPIAAMLHFGDPDWYDVYVEPLRAHYVQPEKVQVEPPSNKTDLQAALAKLKEERLAKRAERLKAQGEDIVLREESSRSTLSVKEALQQQTAGEKRWV
ncbi:hypothetical protein T439DRAFT_326189 [Meredithblackwellia eburnea MCA 4105]